MHVRPFIVRWRPLQCCSWCCRCCRRLKLPSSSRVRRLRTSAAPPNLTVCRQGKLVVCVLWVVRLFGYYRPCALSKLKMDFRATKLSETADKFRIKRFLFVQYCCSLNYCDCRKDYSTTSLPHCFIAVGWVPERAFWPIKYFASAIDTETYWNSW